MRTLIVMAAALAAAPTLAQSEPELVNLTTIEIRSDMTQEWEELQKELNEALKKAGTTERRISQVVRGPTSQYFIVTPVDKFADFDEPGLLEKALGEAGAARWVARVTKCVKERRVDTLGGRPDLSIPPEQGRTPTLVVVETYHNLPGRYPEYNDWLTNKWVPAQKQAGMNGVLYFRNAFGGGRRDWTVVTFVDSWATFDGTYPVREALGEERFFELVSESSGMRSNGQRKVARLRPDLSIIPEPGLTR